MSEAVDVTALNSTVLNRPLVFVVQLLTEHSSDVWWNRVIVEACAGESISSCSRTVCVFEAVEPSGAVKKIIEVTSYEASSSLRVREMDVLSETELKQ